MFTQRAHGWGALAGAVTSSILVTWVWLNTEVHFFLYGAIGFVASYVLGYCFSVLLPVRGDEVEIPEGALPESE